MLIYPLNTKITEKKQKTKYSNGNLKRQNYTYVKYETTPGNSQQNTNLYQKCFMLWHN